MSYVSAVNSPNVKEAEHLSVLLHEISLRSDVNRMDARNLAIVLTPNLVASSNPLKDVQICAVEGSPEPLSPASRSSPPSPPIAEAGKRGGKSSLGTIIRICIHRYFEVFDEISDRTEAADLTFDSGGLDGTSDTLSGSTSLDANKRLSLLRDDDSLDDTMLVMPLGPNGIPSSTAKQFSDSASNMVKPRAWPPKGGARSVTSGDGRSAPATLNKARTRSLFASTADDALTSSSTSDLTGKNGFPSSVSANGTLRKSSGAPVAAHNVTASGFFTPPESAPPVPPLPPVHPSLARHG